MPARITPLLRFLRALTKEQREAFASACDTTEVYLYQLAAAKHPNPRLRLAIAMVDESRRIAKRVAAEPLSLSDLTVGTAGHEDKPPTARVQARRLRDGD